MSSPAMAWLSITSNRLQIVYKGWTRNGKSSANKRNANGQSFKSGSTNAEERVDMFDMDGLMRSLADTRKVFHSEADFQHALAWHIHEAMPESQIRLEVDVMQVERQRR